MFAVQGQEADSGVEEHLDGSAGGDGQQAGGGASGRTMATVNEASRQAAETHRSRSVPRPAQPHAPSNGPSAGG